MHTQYDGQLIHELSGLQYGQTKTGLRSYESGTMHDDMIMSLALAVYGAGEMETYDVGRGISPTQVGLAGGYQRIEEDYGGVGELFSENNVSLEDLL